MADKPTNKERLKELGEKIEAGIREVFDSGKYAEYLKVMSRFPTYSVNNQMLIRLQRPNATKVAGYNKWQQFERHVKRGEHGITFPAGCGMARATPKSPNAFPSYIPGAWRRWTL